MSAATPLRLLPGRMTVLGGLLAGAGACLVGAALLRPGPGAIAPGCGILAMLCGGGGLILLCRGRGFAPALMLALGMAMVVAAISIASMALTLGAGLVWGAASLVLCGVLARAGADRQPALLLPGCLALAGFGLGLALVEVRLSAVGPLAYACAGVSAALAWVCLVGPQRPAGDVHAACGRSGILLSGLLATWATMTVDPWQARPPSERFIISYLESRQAAGERFDQDAFLRSFDTDEEEHAVVVGAGARALHLFIARTQAGVEPRRIALLAQAIAGHRLSLCIHPVAGGRLADDEAWVAALQRQPQSWAAWLGDPASGAAAAGRGASTAGSRAALAGTVRAQARSGVTATPAWVVADAGATPRLLSLPALDLELQPPR